MLRIYVLGACDRTMGTAGDSIVCSPMPEWTLVYDMEKGISILYELAHDDIVLYVKPWSSEIQRIHKEMDMVPGIAEWLEADMSGPKPLFRGVALSATAPASAVIKTYELQLILMLAALDPKIYKQR